MRPSVIGIIVLATVLALLGIRQIQLSGAVAALTREKRALLEQQAVTETRLTHAEAALQSAADAQPVSSFPNPNAVDASAQTRIAALEAQVRTLTNLVARSRPTRGVPEYDPTQPASLDAVESAPVTNAAPGRPWGMEQATGAPDTERAGDIPTAWASREPDAGTEWLSLGFERVTELAEVRIRETHNPGAISKVAAVVNGQEVVLWEGNATGGAAPRDFVVRVNGSVQAQNVIVHLDTTRVAGWNEIDAVELVGRDGTRQWATAANASSTYAERTGAGNSQVDFLR